MSFFSNNPELYTWVILPILIFLARICDVSMETIRVIYIDKGIKYLAPIIAFFEIVIWLLAIEVVMRDLSNIANFLASAFGFAMGTYIGLVIEEKLIIGTVILRIVTTEDSTDEMVSFMQSENYGITPVDATGYRGNIKMIQSFVNRVDAPQITAHFQSTNPHAIFSIEDVQYENEGVFRQKKAQCFHWYVSFVHTTPEEKITSE